MTKTARTRYNRTVKAANKLRTNFEAFERGALKAGETFVRNDIHYVVNKKGYGERQPSAKLPAGREDVIALLKEHPRQVHASDILFAVGPTIMKFLIEKKFIVRVEGFADEFLVSKAGRLYYGFDLRHMGVMVQWP